MPLDHGQAGEHAAGCGGVGEELKSVGASLKVKWTVEELAATLTSWLSMVTAAVGVTVSTVKLPVSAAVPALPLSSCQLLLTVSAVRCRFRRWR